MILSNLFDTAAKQITSKIEKLIQAENRLLQYSRRHGSLDNNRIDTSYSIDLLNTKIIRQSITCLMDHSVDYLNYNDSNGDTTAAKNEMTNDPNHYIIHSIHVTSPSNATTNNSPGPSTASPSQPPLVILHGYSK